MTSVLRVKDDQGNIIEIPAIKGDKGDKGDPGDVPASRTINGKPLASDVVLSAADVGAAPSGYGLGKTTYDNKNKITTLAEADALTHNGWYHFVGDANQNLGGFSYSAIHVVTSRYDVFQTLYAYHSEYGGLCVERRAYNHQENAWSEWEWVNPPMIMGVEYRTTERFRGKVVYTQRIDCGELVGGVKWIEHNVPAASMLRCAGRVTNGSESYDGTTLPIFNANADRYISVSATRTNVLIDTSYEVDKTFGSFIEVQLWYLKD